ncbi:hypothetical protein UlMin_035910 [Ulmus minor]
MGVEEGTGNADGTDCTEGLHLLNAKAVDNDSRGGGGSDTAGLSSGTTERIKTYKRRKIRSSAESKLQENGGPHVSLDSQLQHQPEKETQGMIVEHNSCEETRRRNGSNDFSQPGKETEGMVAENNSCEETRPMNGSNDFSHPGKETERMVVENNSCSETCPIDGSNDFSQPGKETEGKVVENNSFEETHPVDGSNDFLQPGKETEGKVVENNSFEETHPVDGSNDFLQPGKETEVMVVENNSFEETHPVDGSNDFSHPGKETEGMAVENISFEETHPVDGSKKPGEETEGMVVENNSCVETRPMNGSSDSSQQPWRNFVLEHMYQSLSDDEGGIRGCIQDALKEHDLTDKDMHIASTKCLSNGFQKETSGHVDFASNGDHVEHCTVSELCQHAFHNVLVSEKFSSLCKLVSDHFEGTKTNSFLDFSHIDSRMKEGIYETSPMLFVADIQQVWEKIQEIGTEMISLAKGLSEVSRTCYDKEFLPRKPDCYAKLEHTDDCSLYRVGTCKSCGHEAEGKGCLVCDSCEDMYHISCIKPAVAEIPRKNWYCATCTLNGVGSPHEDCVVCDRLKDPKPVTNGVVNGFVPSNEETSNLLGENLTYSTDDGSERSKGPEVEGDQEFCKVCGSEVKDSEESMICGHNFCPSRHYHERCLSGKQLELHGHTWYCPSCLCRSCLTDKDDDKIILCDGCDYAYHLYCMEPPRTTIPRGKWYCSKCDSQLRTLKRAKRMQGRSAKKLKRMGKEGGMGNEGGMEMLLTAVSTINNEEKLARN